MSKSGFSTADLQSAAKRLNTVDAPAADSKSGAKPDASGLDQLEELYERHNGDLDKIFDELRADPSKAKKPHHRPKNAKEFAEKYMEGYYSLVSEADEKPHNSRK